MLQATSILCACFYRMLQSSTNSTLISVKVPHAEQA